ncbi:TIGR00282 family metallophosphoesterase [Streptosporangium oxazolinicum]|uniref:TIGR00282 family metallophosphoesterase n=1 Tax=Streptosporangium oxazolinicum TaxID=909287 RepID=A0ABP8AL71_9ACTN
MRILFFGDIVGDRATAHIAERLSDLRREYDADLVIANAENCAPNGLGMAAKQIDQLLLAGVDVITGGNHSWDSDESTGLLALEQVLRPANLAPDVPGRGVLTLDAAGEKITVINLADHCAMKSVKKVAAGFRPAYEGWLAAERIGTVIVDYHGDHVLEKQIFAHAVDGEASAVIGTHSHEATTALHLLPGGTGFVTEVGMTGPAGGVQGFAPEVMVAGLRTTGNPFSGDLPAPGDGPITLGAVCIEIHDGRTTDLRRVAS